MKAWAFNDTGIASLRDSINRELAGGFVRDVSIIDQLQVLYRCVRASTFVSGSLAHRQEIAGIVHCALLSVYRIHRKPNGS